MQRLAVALAVILAGYAVVAASTAAFTGSADLVTALPIVALAVLVLACWPLRPRPVPPPASFGPDPPEQDHPWRAWVVLFCVIVAWELAEYAARGSRAEHPTLSSMLDAVDRTYLLKAAMFFLWLCLGAAIVWSGRRRPRPADPRPEAQPGLP